MRSPVLGLDFSGAAKAGRKIWLATGVVASGRLLIKSCHPATQLTGGSSDRDASLSALRAIVAALPEAAMGCDFPFSLPTALIEAGSWLDFAANFGRRYPTPQCFRHTCRTKAGQKELKRATEVAAKVPFAAYNLRIYRQTYYGIRDFLAPLVASGAAAVAPMMEPLPDKALVIEVCPASALKRLGLYIPYKGTSSSRTEARRTILSALLDRGEVALADDGLQETIRGEPEGDALDSVIAAAITLRALKNPSRFSRAGVTPAIEGYVFA